MNVYGLTRGDVAIIASACEGVPRAVAQRVDDSDGGSAEATTNERLALTSLFTTLSMVARLQRCSS